MPWMLIFPWSVALLLAGLGGWLLVRRQKHASLDALTLFQQQLSALQAELHSSLEGSTERITHYLQQQSGQWQQTHQTVGSRLENAARVVQNLDQRMAKVEEATKRVFEVGRDIATLQEILRSPKPRGNLGEQFLGDLLAQMLPQDSYALQYQFQNGERIDAVIHTMQGMVAVDAKFPLENFQRMIAAPSDEARKPWRKNFSSDVKKHIDDIARKYILPGEGTFDFALMYVPAENVYYEIIARDEDTDETASIATHAMKKRVIPVSPNTFYAYLNTILLGLRGMRVERFAKDILKDMGRMRSDVEKFAEDFGTLGKHLGNATSAYGKAEKRLSRIDDRLSSFEGSSELTMPEPGTFPEEAKLIS